MLKKGLGIKPNGSNKQVEESLFINFNTIYENM